MKVGCCLGISPSGFSELIKIKYSGAEFIETSLSKLSLLSDEEIKNFADITASIHLPCVALNAMFPPTIKLVGKNIDYAEAKDYMWKAFEKVSVLPVKHVTFGSGPARSYPDDMSHEEATEQLTSFLSTMVAPAVEKYGIVCGIEALTSSQTNVFTTCSEIFKVVKAVNKPSIRMIIDNFHFFRENEILESIKNYEGYVSHVHISNLSDARTTPMPTDSDDYKAFVIALRDIGYDGYLSSESSIPEPFYETLTTSMAFLKTL